MNRLFSVGIASVILTISCNNDSKKSYKASQVDEISQESHEQKLNTPTNYFEKIKTREERFVVIGVYNYQQIFTPYLTKRIYGKVIFDSETEVIELRISDKYGLNDTLQMRVGKLVSSDNIFESYKITSVDNDRPNTLVLVDNGMLLGPYPAEIKSNEWVLFCDLDKFKQVDEDINHYLDEIEDISFEIK